MSLRKSRGAQSSKVSVDSKMTSRNRKQKREAGQRKLSLLTGLARFEEESSGSPGSKAFSELEDNDPYKFVGSQSMEVQDQDSHKPKGKNKSKESAKLPSLTESERLQLQEEEDIKRAIEASLQDANTQDAGLQGETLLENAGKTDSRQETGKGAKKQDKGKGGGPSRKRRRGPLEQSLLRKQDEKFKSVQKIIERTKEIVVAAKKLGNEATSSKVSLRKARPISPEGEVVCEDPPSFFESPPPPPTLPEEMAPKSGGATGGRQLDSNTVTLSPSPGNSDTGRSKVLPLSQLKPSVSIRKLSLNRSGLSSRRRSDPEADKANEQGTATHSTTSATITTTSSKRMRVAGGTDGPLPSSISGGSMQHDIVAIDDDSPPPPVPHKESAKDKTLTPTRDQRVDRKEDGSKGQRSMSTSSSGLAASSNGKSARDKTLTPTRVDRKEDGSKGQRSSPTSSNRMSTNGIEVGSKRRGVVDTEADTPPLPSAHSRRQLSVTATKLPLSDHREAGTTRAIKLSRPTRRNLSLSYTKKLGERKQRVKVLAKPSNCDETIEIDRTVLDDSPPDHSPLKEASKNVQKEVGVADPPPALTMAGTTECPVPTEIDKDPIITGQAEGGDVVDGRAVEPGHAEGAVRDARTAEDSGDSDATAGSPRPPSGAQDPSSNHENEADDLDTHMEVEEEAGSASGGPDSQSTVSSTADGIQQGDNLDEHQPKRIKLSHSESVGVTFKPKKRVVEELRAHPPPVLFAEGAVLPAQYTKVILSSFNSYFSQLAQAQRRVLYRVQWGEPLKCSSKQPGRKRSSRRLDSYLKLSLRLGSPRARRPSDSDFSLSEFSPSSKKQLPAPSDSEGDSGAGFEAEEDLDVVGNAAATPPRLPDVGFEESPDVSHGARADAILIGTQEEEEERGEADVPMEELSERDTDLCAPHQQGPILISTQSSPRDPAGDAAAHPSPSSCYQPSSPGLDVLAVDSQLLGDFPSSLPLSERPTSSPGPVPDLDPATAKHPEVEAAETDSQILHHILSSPSPLSDNTPSPAPRLGPRLSPVGKSPAEKEASPWLSTRKPPPSQAVKKTRKRATPTRPRASKAPKAKVAKKADGKKRRVGRSAAARLLQSKANASSNSSSEDDGEGAAEPTRQALSESHSDSSSEGEDRVGSRILTTARTAATTARSTLTSRSTSAKRGGGVIDLTEDLLKTGGRTAVSSSPPISKQPCPLCNQLFAEDVIEAHASNCMGAGEEEEEEEGKSRCPRCHKLFESSLIEIHMEQCGGEGDDSSDEDLPVRRHHPIAASSARNRRKSKGGVGSTTAATGAAVKGRGGRKGGEEQLTLSKFCRMAARSSSPGIQNDDVIEIPDPIARTTAGSRSRRTWRALSRDDTPEPESTVTDEGHYAQPMAVRCEDGGYMVDPSTISNSPIRTYTPLNALAPEERDTYQNQFQTTRHVRSHQNAFDELIGEGSGATSGWNTKRKGRGGGASAKKFTNWNKARWKKKRK